MTRKKHIHSIESLDQEILRLKHRQSEIEKDLGTNFDHLRSNYGSMAFNSIFKKKSPAYSSTPDSNHFWGGLTARILDNEKLQDNVGGLVERLITKVSDGIESIFGKPGKKPDPF